VDPSLTDRGLVDLEFLWICGAALSLTLAFAIGRWWALAVPVTLTSLIFFGVDQDWWGGGLAEGWEAVFAWSTTVGLALAGLGIVVSFGIRRLRGLGPALRLAIVGACIAALGGYWYAKTRPPDLDEFRTSARPFHYLGNSFEGFRLTHAELEDGAAFLVYGDCDTALGSTEGGCGPPLQLKNVTCPGERAGVAILASAGGGQAYRAIRALRPIRAGVQVRRPRAAVTDNSFGPCLPDSP
jgi:hypothetical protein